MGCSCRVVIVVVIVTVVTVVAVVAVVAAFLFLLCVKFVLVSVRRPPYNIRARKKQGGRATAARRVLHDVFFSMNVYAL